MTLVMVVMMSSSTSFANNIELGWMEYSPRDIITSLQSGYGFIEDVGGLNSHNDRIYTHNNFISGFVSIDKSTSLIWCGVYQVDLFDTKLTNTLHEEIRKSIGDQILKIELLINDFNLVKFNQNILLNINSIKRDVFSRFEKVAPKGVTLKKFEIISIIDKQ